MKRIAFSHTVRGRLLFLAIGIEALMLTLMVANSLRLLHTSMTDQARWQAAQMAPVLIAALKAPVVQQDFATVQAVIDESRKTDGIDYVVITDKAGKRVASSGWQEGDALPNPSIRFDLLSLTHPHRFDVTEDITSSGQLLGRLHFGLDLSHIVAARNTLLLQGVGIAFLEIVCSTVILFLLGIWLTRHLAKLTSASLDVAAGNLTPDPVPEGQDDIGQLGAAFNTMSRAVSERIIELTCAKEAAELNEKAKSESEERLKLVMEGSNDGIWDWDIQSGRIEINRRWAEMIGYSPDELPRHVDTWAGLVHPDDLARVQAELNAHLEGRTAQYQTEHRIRTKSGEWAWILDRGKVVARDPGGTPLRAAGTHTDITGQRKVLELLQEQTGQLEQEVAERQRTQEDLAVKQAQLESLNIILQQRIDQAVSELRQKDQLMISQSRQAAMGEMIGNIAHQWRQPLNALAMVLGNIRSAYDFNELTAEYLEKTVDNGNRLIQKMSSTINDFRNFFKPDKEIVVFSAQDQITHAVSLVSAGLSSHNIEVTVDVDHDVVLKGFPNEYSQVLLNLLGNSRDAIKEAGVPRGSIMIRLYEQDGFGCVSVRDNGGGIDCQVIDKIFEPYFSTKNMGTGIGLYMSKMIIEHSMNGTIEVRNVEHGAEFIIKMPLEGTEP